MTPPLPLRDLLSGKRPDDRPQFVHDGCSVTFGQLRADAADFATGLAGEPAGDWALYHGDAYPFAVALLAVLASGGRAWLPADATPGTARKLAAHCDGWLGTAWAGAGPCRSVAPRRGRRCRD